MKNVSARMAMVVRNLPIEVQGDYTVVVRFYEDTLIKKEPAIMFKEFCVAYKYDPVSGKWAQGHYFNDLEGVHAFLEQKKKEVSEDLFRPF